MDSDAGTWVLQAEAAARTGFSLSAIRKWRRLGLVAERKILSGTGMQRVEVRLEDVLDRAALHPERQRATPGMADADDPERRVVLGFDDLEELFERLFSAEQRADRAEAELASLRAQVASTSAQMPELRRSSDESIGQSSDRSRRPSEGIPPAAMGARHEATAPSQVSEGSIGGAAISGGTQPPVRAERGSARSVVDEGIQGRDSPDLGAAGDTPLGGHAGQQANQHEELASRLRASYARLDRYRREGLATPADEQQRQRELAEYDRVLVAVCAALNIPRGVAIRQPISPETRASLTRALAQAGLDVRGEVPASTRRRPQRVPWKRNLDERRP